MVGMPWQVARQHFFGGKIGGSESPPPTILESESCWEYPIC